MTANTNLLTFSQSFKQGQAAANRMALHMWLGYILPLLLPLIFGHFVSGERNVIGAIGLLVNFSLGLALTLPYAIKFYRRDRRGGAYRKFVVPATGLRAAAVAGVLFWGMMTLVCVAELIVVANL